MVYRVYDRSEPPPWSPATPEQRAEYARLLQNAYPSAPEAYADAGDPLVIRAPEVRKEENRAWIRHVQRYRTMVRNSVPYLNKPLEGFKARQLRKREVEALERLAGKSPSVCSAMAVSLDRPRPWWRRLMWWRR